MSNEALNFRESDPQTADVIKRELEEINVERALRGLPALTSTEESIGLAISGGGIRSATFGLGVLQKLRDLGLLPQVDYLSTVSGGGYIGSWFAANRLRRPDDVTDSFLQDDHEAVRHLRRYGRYLTPKTGFLSADTWTAIAIWLRNTVSIQCLLLVFLMLVMLLPHFAVPVFDWMAAQEWPFYKVAFGSLAAASLIGMGCLLFPRRRQCIGAWPELVVMLLVLVAGYLIAPLIWSEVELMRDANATGEKKWWEDKAVFGMACFFALLTPLGRAVCLDARKYAQGSVGKKALRLLLLLCSFAIQIIIMAALGYLCGAGLFMFMEKMFDYESVQMNQVIHQAVPTVTASAGLSGLAAFFSQPELLSSVAESMAQPHGMEWAAIVGGPLVLLSFSILIGAGISLSGTDIHDRHREWWARLGAWLFMLSLGTLALELLALKGPALVTMLLPEVKGQIPAAFLWLVTSGLGLKLADSAETNGSGSGSRIKEKLLSLAPLFFFSGLMLTVAALVEGMVSYVVAHDVPIRAYLSWLPQLDGKGTMFVPFVGLLVLLFILLSHFDINELSMNLFYRNRLMRCYLGGARPQADRRPATFTGFDFNDDLLLSEMGATSKLGQSAQQHGSFRGPFWVVNTALNTSKNPDLDVAERLAESFTLTPLHCGFQRAGMGIGSGIQVPQGYRPTNEYMAGIFGAAAAVSISGAAASPNSGYHTSPLIAFMLTVFNARLGWWVANPARPSTWKNERPPAYKGMGWYVLKEVFGGASVSDPFIYLSDGGHFENLGMYELVRRRCRMIIVSDAEEDGAYSFHGLGTAIRRCWVDFRVKIEINTSSISPAVPGGLCRGHCAIGTIRYDPEDPSKNGTLIYLKSSWTGDEPTDLQQYRAANAAFPHESTGDQFFSESQFESYRKLGRHVAGKCLTTTVDYVRKILPDTLLPPGVQPAGQPPAQTILTRSLSRSLMQYWAPLTEGSDSEFIRNTDALVGIWKDVQNDPDLRWLTEILLPEADLQGNEMLELRSIDISQLPESSQRAGRFLCQRLFQLMENVFLDLDLGETHQADDNSGWMNLFRHWVRHDYIQTQWKKSRDTYGHRFGAFWTQRLNPNIGTRPAAVAARQIVIPGVQPPQNPVA